MTGRAQDLANPILNRAIPNTMVNINGQDLHAVRFGIGHQLRRSVETHRQTVDNRCAKRGRVVMLQPSRNVNEFGKTGGVRLGETVFAKPANLTEHLLCKLARQTALFHPVDQFFMELIDQSGFAPFAHRPPQLIGFARREPGRDDGKLHCLFLKDRNPQRPVQDCFDFFVGINYRLLTVATLQIGMNHVTLDRTRPNDRDFDHQVIPTTRLEARQHAHLTAAFDLKNTNRIGSTNHVVNPRVVLRDIGQRTSPSPMLLNHVKTFSDRRQHSQTQTIDFEQTKLFQVVLVPLDHRPIVHRSVLDRHQLIKPSLGNHHSAHVLGKMAGESEQFADQVIHLSPDVRLWVDPNILHLAG